MAGRAFWEASVLAIVTGLGTPALAQDAPPAAGQPDAAQTSAAGQLDTAQTAAATMPDTGAVGEVVVTAQRREERLQDVPISITAFTAESLTKSDTTNLARLANFTPGFSFGQSGQDARPGIRGTRTTPDGGGDTVIGYYVDDVFQPLAVQASQPFVDVARVEIARGPQGTLFGRNTFGGAISVVNALPGKELEGGFDLTYGNYERVRATGFASVPITDSLGVRLAVLREKRDGYIKNVAFGGDPGLPGNNLGDLDRDYVRGTVRFKPSSNLDILLRGTYWHEGGAGSIALGGYKLQGILVSAASCTPVPAAPTRACFNAFGSPISFFAGSAADNDGVPDFNGVDLGRPVSPDPYAWQGRFRGLVDLNSRQGNGQIRWSNDSIFIRSITGYQDFKYRGNSGNAFGPVVSLFALDRNTETFTQELQIGGAQTTPFQWIAGVYYYDEKSFEQLLLTSLNAAGVATSIQATSGVQDRMTKSYAGYAQASLNVTDALKLTAGGRYTRDKKQLDASTFSQNLLTGVVATPTAITRDATFNRFTWRLGADYKLARDHLLYASASTGFRSGGFNAGVLTQPLVPATFAPERVTAYEIGSKNQFLDRTLQLNVAAFYNDYRNLQLSLAFPVPGTPTILTAILNAGAARAYGVEAEAIWRPVPELTLNATAELTNARFTDFSFFGRIANPYPLQTLDLRGNQITRTPDHKFTVGAAYDIRIPGFGTITPQANALFSDSYYNTEYNTPLDRQKAYTTVDASLGYRTEDDRISLEAFVTNLTNKAVQISGSFGSQSLLTNYAPPRFYGLRLSFRN